MQMMYIIFENQITTLDDVIQNNIKELKQKNKDVNIEEWTTHTGTDTSKTLEFIMINTEKMYTENSLNKSRQILI
jgi:hypothetical protein